MISPKPQMSLSNAKTYFREHLAVGDYYSESDRVRGEWQGVGAARLGLRGEISEEAFLRLCEGLDPATGDRLTARLNKVRTEKGKVVANRRVFYDWTIAPPKSVSLVALIENPEVVKLHEAAVRVAVAEAEKYAQTRVRRGRAQWDRQTANVVAALFRHETSRALDPHLHTHCILMNVTYDEVEGRWKALQTHDMLKARRMVDAVYNSVLCEGLVKMGYKIERRVDTYEIAGIDRKLVEKFSKRHMSIEEKALAMVAAGMASAAELPKLRDRIAHEERERKIKDADGVSLRKKWLEEMTPAERLAVLKSRDHRRRELAAVPDPVRDVNKAVELAREIIFERNSVVDAREVERVALMQTLGSGIRVDDVRGAMAANGILREPGTNDVTSVETLKAEMDVVAMARAGRGTMAPINAAVDASGPGLDAEQAGAVQELCAFTGFVTRFRGVAGAGKSNSLVKLCAVIEAAGLPLVVLAPQTQQAQEMRDKGMATAATLASFLARGEVSPGAVVVLDEAGQVSTRDLRELLEKVKAGGGRVIMSGDTRQHGSVQASDALIALERFGQIECSEIRKVWRQDPSKARDAGERKRIEELRDAVVDAADGMVARSLAKLEGIGAVRQVAPEVVAEQAAVSYVEARESGRVVLAVSQTRQGAAAVNDAVAERLAERGHVKDAAEYECLVVRDLVTAERRDRAQYQVGTEVVFVRNYGANKRGEVARVIHVDQDTVLLEPKAGELKARRLSLNHAGRWNIVDRKTLSIGVGTRLQVKFNGTSREGHAIVNGELVTVAAVHKDGALRVRDLRGEFKTIDADKRLVNLGYCVTSYGSQGKTVDVVVLADSGSELATDAKQWYVSISRARREAVVITPDKVSLADRITVDHTRKLAMSLNVSIPSATAATAAAGGPGPGARREAKSEGVAIDRRVRVARRYARRLVHRVGKGVAAKAASVATVEKVRAASRRAQGAAVRVARAVKARERKRAAAMVSRLRGARRAVGNAAKLAFSTEKLWH